LAEETLFECFDSEETGSCDPCSGQEAKAS